MANFINTYIIIYFILHALQEHKIKHKMQADLDLLQQKIKEVNIAKEFIKAEKRAIENKVDVLQKQIANLKNN
jgi:polyhydroxyalkanoate synthesis regulator phasin